ncbi:MAG: BREX-2 system phosphatase PglZ, partial [Streptosporangiaceae bacterium]
RWNETGHAADAQAMCDRAEQLLRELGAGDIVGNSSILDAGLDARVTALADLITGALPVPRPGDLAALDAALAALKEHRRSAGRAVEGEAEAAVRLVRWLATDEPGPATTVADGAERQVRSWAWADRALAVIASPDTSRTPRAQTAYAALHETVRRHRAVLDQAFAGRLAAWSPAAGTTDDLLLVENVLQRIARPLTTQAAPLIIVVDGMSAAVALTLADDIAATRIWDEAGRHEDGREGALTALPSATTFSRTSLLCAKLQAGAQAQERAGFAAYWHGRSAALYHKADLPAGPGGRLSRTVLTALSDSATVVGVILNTIDDALRDGPPGNPSAWRLADVTFLPELLTAAAGAGRPVVLTSDHGHVLDHAGDIHPATAEAARYRHGQPGDGEVLVSGPRVLTDGGRVVLPWDESIRYTPRKAGYHGGASLAETVVPVLVFVPSGAPIPQGWARYGTPSLHEPSWWNPAGTPARPSLTPASAIGVTAPPSRGKKSPEPADALFSTGDILASASLGAGVAASGLYTTQRAFVRKAPDDASVAAILDALAEAGGKLPVTTVATLAGQPPFRMAGYLAQLGRLLNVDGYPVIGGSDEGRTVALNVALLREQFLGRAR